MEERIENFKIFAGKLKNAYVDIKKIINITDEYCKEYIDYDNDKIIELYNKNFIIPKGETPNLKNILKELLKDYCVENDKILEIYNIQEKTTFGLSEYLYIFNIQNIQMNNRILSDEFHRKVINHFKIRKHFKK
jgi:hypothetical protein